MSTITEETMRSLALEVIETDRTLVGAGGRALNVIGASDVSISSKQHSVNARLYVLAGSSRNLLGLPQLRQLNLLAGINALSAHDFNPISEFPGVFTGLGTMPGTFKITLGDNVEPKRLLAPRPIAAGLRDKARAELDNMLREGVIVPVERPTEWCSGLTIAPKKGGKIRMCVDLTQLNKCVRREIYPFPRISDMLSRLSGNVMFSKLDAYCGFWQVKLDPESRLLTTFVTPWGRFCFKRMPFGISSAPEFFQRAMEKILEGLDGVICLMDDVLIFGKTAKEHWTRVRNVLKRIEKAGMTLKKEKCEFGVREVKFLGHLVNASGIKPDPDKVKAIIDMLPPADKTEARRFTGLVNYLSKFSHRIAELCAPIHAISGSKSEWFWGPAQQEAFESLKTELSKSPVLCNFDLAKKHRVSADASKTALGAVLLQLTPDGLWQPVEYASRKMTETEQRYAMIEKEALATTWACEKFDYYLVGRHFEIETDHKPLISVLGEKDLSQLPVRVQRFKLRLMRYDYDIFYTPGKDMFLADSLSRPNSANLSDHDISSASLVEAYVNAVLSSSLDSNSLEEALTNAMRDDAVSMQCSDYIKGGWPKSAASLTGELANLYVCRDKLSVYNDLILYGSRIYIPIALRAGYLQRCHEGHQGISKCRRRAQRHFWWPGLSGEIADLIATCDTCIKNSSTKHQPMVESELPSRPWEVLGADLFQFDNENYLVVIDYYSKWIEAVPVRTQTSGSVIRALKHIFAMFGYPDIIRSDNGPCFNCKEFREFAKSCLFTLNTSSPHYPPSNGLAESAVKTVKGLWRKNDDKENALFIYRTTPLSSGYTPSDLMFGRPIKTCLGIPYDSDVDFDEYEEHERTRRSKIKKSWDAKYRANPLSELGVGQKIYVKTPGMEGTTGIVVRKDPAPDSYWVRIGSSEVRRNRKHLFVLYDSPTVIYRAPDDSDESEHAEPNVETAIEAAPPEGGPSDVEMPWSDPTEVGASGGSSDEELRSGDAGDAAPRVTVTRSGRVSRQRRDPHCYYY